MKIFVIILLSLSVSLSSTAFAEENTLIDHFFQGAASEAGSRIMGAIIDGMASEKPHEAKDWIEGASHPRYPNIISDTKTNTWRPATGYVWANVNDQNDWTVIPSNVNRNTYFIGNTNKSYEVVYVGRDGVNLRSSPGGKDIISTAYKQNLVSIKGLSEAPYYLNGIPWVKVKLIGWMAKRVMSNSYITLIDSSFAYVSWDGNGNPTDNFVALRAGANTKTTLIAQVYTNTSLRIIESKLNDNSEWVKAEVIGWMAIKGSSKGNQFLVEITE